MNDSMNNTPAPISNDRAITLLRTGGTELNAKARRRAALLRKPIERAQQEHKARHARPALWKLKKGAH